MNDMQDLKPNLLQLSQRYAALPAPRRELFRARLHESEISPSRLPIVPLATRSNRAPLSFAQERLWFLWKLSPESAAYNISGAIRLEGELVERALQAALEALLARHESLRTHFEEQDGVPHQVVDEAPLYGFARHDLCALSRAQRDVQARSLLDAAASAPFDLERGPLLRVTLIRIDSSAHVLALALHHIVADGWSLGILWRELVACYAAACEARAADLPSLSLQYADYARWQREWSNDASLQAQLAYWREALGTEHPPLVLPSDGASPTSSGDAGRVARDVPTELVWSLRRLAQEQGATLFMVLLSAFTLLLQRHSGVCDLRVGVPIAGRERRETEGLIGLFINTLVLRVQLRVRARFDELLDQVRRCVLDGQSHRDVPFARVVEALQPERDLVHPPLFQVLFNLERDEARALAGLPGLSLCEVEHARASAAKFPLSLHAIESPELVRLSFEYARDRFGAEQVARWADEYLAILRELPGGWDRAIDELGMPARPRDPGLGRAAQESVLARVAAVVEARPGDTALVDAERRLTWSELWRWSGALAGGLAALGVQRERAVALCLPRKLELVIGLLAVWRAGGMYVPCDPSWPAERLAWQLTDSDALCVLGDAALGASLIGGRVVLDPAQFRAEPPAAAVLCRTALADQAAYAIYTSGTAGHPKGVVVSHGALASYIEALWQRLPEGIHSAAYVSTPAADLGHSVLFGALAAGITLHLLDDAVVSDPDAFGAYMHDQRVDLYKIVPSHLAGLLSAAAPERVLPERCLIIGGEVMSAELAGLVGRLKPSCLLLNHYGPTETTVGVLTRAGACTTRTHLPLGRPLAQSRVYLLDEAGRALPDGAVGEIAIGGASVARGYLKGPRLTAERFVPDPYGAPGSRLYRSGDKARMLADGELEFLGRYDDQVKIRGYRVEPEEVAARLGAQPGVLRAVVIARADGAGQVRLLAYVTGRSLDGERLRSALAAELPGYMVPSAVLVLEALPLTPNGKVDRRALPEPGQIDAPARVAPRNANEAALLEIWRSVLQRPELGVTDNFFEVGGESILSLQVVARARRAGLELTARQIFEHPCIEQLAAAVSARAPAVALSPAPLYESLPLAPSQARFFAQHPDGSHHYNQAVLLEVHGELAAADLERALGLLVERHDALRLRFEQTAQGWRQIVAVVETSALLERHDLSDDVATWRERLAALGQRLHGSLDLERGPLLRAAYFRVREGEGRLLLVIHHLAVDGVSWRILLEELEQLCEPGSASEPTDSGLPWSVWVSQLAGYARGLDASAEIGSWRAMLSEARRTVTAAGVSLSKYGTSRELEWRLGRASTERLLQAAPRAYRLRVDELLLTALARALGAWAGAPGALIELEGHGREDVIDGVDLSRCVGWFTTRFPIWLEARSSERESLLYTKERLRSLPRRGVHFGLLLHSGESATRQVLAALPRPEVSFNYLGRFDQALAGHSRFRFADEPAGEPISGDSPLAHALALDAIISGGALSIGFRFDPAVLEETRVRRLIAGFEDQLAGLIEHCLSAAPEPSATDFPLADLSQAELERLDLELDEVQDIYAATPLQQGLLFHTLAETGEGIYVNQRRLTLRGALDGESLRAAWEAAVEQHDILRTAFAWSHGGAALQVVQRRVSLPYAEHDWRAERDYDERLAAWRAADLRRGFEHSQAPLLRIDVFARPDGQHDLIWTNHHALLDGWSTSRLLGEVVHDYRARVAGQAPRRVAPGLFRSYVAWQRRQPSSEPFWRARFATLDDPGRLLDALEPRREKSLASALRQTLSLELSERVRRAASGAQLTLNTLMQGAWAIVLGRYTHRRQVLFGVTVSGRPPALPDMDRTLGLFINSLPVWPTLPADMRALDWLAQQQQQDSELRQHEHTPLQQLRQWASTLLGSVHAVDFDSLVVFESYPIDRELERAQGALVASGFEAQDRTHYPLVLTIVPGASLRLDWEWDASKLEASQIESLAACYLDVLAALAADLRQPLGAFQLSSAERELEVADADEAASVVERVSEQATRRPDAPAVRCGDERLSHGELGAWSDRIAARLGRLGLAPEERVGLCVERSVALAAALLGILKSGGAYVPLDPD
jgi:amino acid adenylation domain-containing protein/non-ribosomal peptide synthase protein (TIGR01720 family)